MSVRGARPRVASVCVMAVLTLTAGAPRLPCRCPDGHLRLFCFGVCPHTPTGRTCGARTPAAPANACCCHPERAPAAGCHLNGTGCTRLLAGPDDRAVPPERTAPAEAPAAVALLPAAADLAPAAGWAHTSRQAHLRSPPDDLLTTLCRLLI
jgi:hypothetical protein